MESSIPTTKHEPHALGSEFDKHPPKCWSIGNRAIGDHDPEQVGPPVACCCIKLVDVPELEYFTVNNQGEICIKGTNVFSGYFRDPEKTAEAIDPSGWHHTGDIGMWLPDAHPESSVIRTFKSPRIAEIPTKNEIEQKRSHVLESLGVPQISKP
ncbi:hypothetical protein QAD02_021351 [Eretmocerus hayati]|uniref:Uncharacterized protein n=1 Tax=Eretmocerus hayati TaxID=131215 RepID=A0ACC2PRC9_9HYME|nr:hypothetical protein QAD02_021351 [Eretmocerus hayati]